MSAFFWEDEEQASQRLTGSVVLYDDSPVYINRIETHADGMPRAYLTSCVDRKESRKKLDSPHFKRFRELPRLGWCNPSVDAGSRSPLFMTRRATATTCHGLKNGNVYVHHLQFGDDGGVLSNKNGYTFTSLMYDKGWHDSHAGDFPALEDILQKIASGTGIAMSRKFCVVRGHDGLRWLYRDLQRVGIFTGVDTLNLLSRFAYLREEIMAEKAFTINTIREF